MNIIYIGMGIFIGHVLALLSIIVFKPKSKY